MEIIRKGRLESNYERRASKCTKINYHSEFIPVDSFRIHHLSEKFRDQDIFTCLFCLCKVTVQIIVNVVSKRGPITLRTGTGRIRYVTEQIEDELCPCDECKDVEKPRRPWCKVGVVTATHVILDKQEANAANVSCSKVKGAKCIIGYDNAESQVDEIVGVGISKHGVYAEGDRFNLCCVTHDLALATRLRKEVDLYKKMCMKVSKQYKHTEEKLHLAVIVSHPHGGPKKVTVGEWLNKVVIKKTGFTSYRYKTCTCPGSSGAPVYIPDRKGLAWCTHPHSKYSTTDSVSCSGYGYD